MTIQTVRRLGRQSLTDRLKALLHQEISFIHCQKFSRMKLADVEWNGGDIYIDEKTSGRTDSVRVVPTDLSSLFRKPLLTPAGEQHLFRRMNYLRYLANRRRSQLDPSHPQVKVIREIEKLIADSIQARTQLVESNLRLVASIAAKFAKSRHDFEELLGEGNAILLYAVDKFDFSRGFRFSTYATHAIQRHFFRVLQRMQRKRSHEVSSTAEMLLETVEAPASEPESELPLLTRGLLRQMAALLDERELFIIEKRYGLRTPVDSEKTLKTLSDEMGLSKERVRQLQHRALDKLREFLVDRGITLDDGD